MFKFFKLGLTIIQVPHEYTLEIMKTYKVDSSFNTLEITIRKIHDDTHSIILNRKWVNGKLWNIKVKEEGTQAWQMFEEQYGGLIEQFNIDC